jgi:hypothetical protein
MDTRLRDAVVILALLLPVGNVGAGNARAGDASAASDGVASVADCMQQNLPSDHSVQDVRFVSRDRAGSQREILATVTWKRFDSLSRSLARVQSPEDLRGVAVLIAERDDGADLFLYSPELQRTRRITSHALSGNLFGSDFTYEDFLLLYGMAERGSTERLPDAELDGRAVWVLAQNTPDDESAYERVVAFVDRDSCLLVKAEMWESGERLRKVLTTDREAVFEQGSVRIPRKILLEDLKKGSSTRLEALTIDLDKKVGPGDVSPRALER